MSSNSAPPPGQSAGSGPNVGQEIWDATPLSGAFWNAQGNSQGNTGIQQAKSGTPPSNAPNSYFQGGAAADEASSQANTNQQTQANRPNQTNAFGASSNWVQGPDGQWTQQTSFGGPMGAAAGNLENQLAQNSGKPFDTGTEAGQQAFTASMNQADATLNPQWAEAGQQEASQLANEGLSPGSAAYNQAMQSFNQGKNNAYQGAENAAVQQGNAEQAQTFNQNMQSMMAPEQELAGLQGFGAQQGFNAANEANPLQSLEADQLASGYGLQQYQLQNQQNAGQMQGLGQLGMGLGNLAFAL